MKDQLRWLAVATALSLVCLPAVIAQNSSTTSPTVATGSSTASGNSYPATGKALIVVRQRRILGTVSAQSGRVTFVRGSDKQSWTVLNPETLTGVAGQRVEVTADIYPDINSIRVLRVRRFPIAGQMPPTN